MGVTHATTVLLTVGRHGVLSGLLLLQMLDRHVDVDVDALTAAVRAKGLVRLSCGFRPIIIILVVEFGPAHEGARVAASLAVVARNEVLAEVFHGLIIHIKWLIHRYLVLGGGVASWLHTGGHRHWEGRLRGILRLLDINVWGVWNCKLFIVDFGGGTLVTLGTRLLGLLLNRLLRFEGDVADWRYTDMRLEPLIEDPLALAVLFHFLLELK